MCNINYLNVMLLKFFTEKRQSTVYLAFQTNTNLFCIHVTTLRSRSDDVMVEVQRGTDMAASISQQLEDLLNPLPKFVDPEDDQDEGIIQKYSKCFSKCAVRHF